MPILKIIQHRGKLTPPIPHQILINKQMVGLMRQDCVQIDIPSGVYEVRIQSLIKWFSSTQKVQVQPGVDNILRFSDRERVWDLLFVADLVLSIAHLFYTPPTPWNWIYKVLTNAYFVLWIGYEFCIRNHYFRTDFLHKIPSS